MRHTDRPYIVRFTCVHSACTQSNCICVNIIIYFYVFKLTACRLEMVWQTTRVQPLL